MRMRTRAVAAGAAVALASTGAATIALASAITGPSSSQPPYVVPSQAGVVTKSILTVGDAVGGYKMVGIPDGLGAFDNGNGTFTVLMNHELGATAGVERAHGAKGSFVSKWTIDRKRLKVLKGEDLIKQVQTWDPLTGAHRDPARGVAIGRLCSADLAATSAWFNAATGKGYDGRLFTSGEEVGAEGRGFAHQLDGTSVELPALGKFSYENILARPTASDRTVVVSTDDSSPGQVYVYVGEKKTSGSAVEKAGLTGGTSYGIRVPGVALEDRAAGIPAGTRFELAALGDVSNRSGAQLEADSDGLGVTEFLRPEDGQWDTQDPDVFYFVTTDRFTTATNPGRSRLWKLTFDDGEHPEAGGTIEAVLDGTEGQQMLDNMTVDARGDVILQEDPGGQDYLARIWKYAPSTDALVEIAHHSADRFTPGTKGFLTRDEESSGVIPAPFLGEGWFLGDVQAHYPNGTELVEGGQLFALQVPPGT